MTNSNNRLELPIAFLKDFVAQSDSYYRNREVILSNLYLFQGVEKRIYKSTARRLKKISRTYDKVAKLQVKILKKSVNPYELRSIMNPGNDAFFGEDTKPGQDIFDRLSESLNTKNESSEVFDNSLYEEDNESTEYFESYPGEIQAEAYFDEDPGFATDRELASLSVNTRGQVNHEDTNDYNLDIPNWVNGNSK